MNAEPLDVSWLQLDYRPKLPKDRSRGIGIVGVGEVVRSCHLPAYRMAGFRVVGLYDIERSRAEALAEQFGIGRVYDRLEELLADPEVEIVDIAVPARYQADIVAKAADKGKHVLCQKPLGESYEDAKRLVETVVRSGITAAVNQQMRWAPGIMACKQLAVKGWLGELLQASVQVNVRTAWEQWPWITRENRLEVMYHSIHYLDAIRYVLGQSPEYIYADGARFPDQAGAGETRTLLHLKFPGEVRGMVHDNHNHIAGQEDWYATFRFEGTEGIAKGTNGALYNYPTGQEDTLQYLSRKIDPDCWIAPKLHGRWFPHAFMGTMGELMLALEERREPENSVRDNLETIRMVMACYRSMQENRAVRLAEFD